MRLVALFAFLAGQTLCAAPFYTVKDGDTPWSIAQSNGLSCAQLCKSNGKPNELLRVNSQNVHRFGRYKSDFVIEATTNEMVSYLVRLYRDGKLIESNRVEVGNSQKPARWIGGGEWEAGFLLLPHEESAHLRDYGVSIGQLISLHEKTWSATPEQGKWSRRASWQELLKKGDEVKALEKEIGALPDEDNTDIFHIGAEILKFKAAYFDMVYEWRHEESRQGGFEQKFLRECGEFDRIKEACAAEKNWMYRGSHFGACWGERLEMDLLDYWTQSSEDYKCWKSVSSMQGEIGGHKLAFHLGFATTKVVQDKDPEYASDASIVQKDSILLFKVCKDFYRQGDFVYARVEGDEPTTCLNCDSYASPAYVVKVNDRGRIINWYPYPTQVKSLKGLLESQQGVEQGCDETLKREKRQAETTAQQDNGVNPMYIVQKGDTLWNIAKAHGLDYGQLCKSNGKLQDWSSIRPGQKIIVAELLDESGDIALFAGKTEADIAFNKVNDWRSRNSLFMRRRTPGGADEWRLIMTAEGEWKLADGMSEWCKGRARDARKDFQVVKARMSKDHRFVWMVCDPHTGTYYLVCSLELATKKFRVLTDGCAVTEQADGTLFVEGKKTYLSDDNGEPNGAAWCDLWITPEGKVVRKTRPISKDEMEPDGAKAQEGKGQKGKDR